MRQRVQRVLAVAASHGHQHLVLGAWACGVCGNDPSLVAALFAEALGGEFESVFRRVVFAVLDSSSEGRGSRPFAERFGARRLTPAGCTERSSQDVPTPVGSHWRGAWLPATSVEA